MLNSLDTRLQSILISCPFPGGNHLIICFLPKYFSWPKCLSSAWHGMGTVQWSNILKVCVLHKYFESIDLKHPAAAPSFDSISFYENASVFDNPFTDEHLFGCNFFAVTNRAALKSLIWVFLRDGADLLLQNGIAWSQSMSLEDPMDGGAW